MTISGARTEQLVIMQVLLPRHWLYGWFSQFRSCVTYSFLSRSPSVVDYHATMGVKTPVAPCVCRWWTIISRVSAMPNHGPVPRIPRSFYAHNVWPATTIFSKVAPVRTGMFPGAAMSQQKKRTQRLPNTLILTALLRRMLNVSGG